mmetsp:Transcript_7164/g.10970  ORF Transcript_7164/g.10970 Transcript_7164/m.10970 type:complete len:112 (+) Transcript_7164:31-366(+)
MGDVQQADPLSFIWDFRRVPCFRSSILYGIITGAALGGHTFYKKRIPMKALDRSVAGFLGMSCLTWVVCRYRYRNEMARIQDFIENQDEITNTAKSRVPAELAPSPSDTES